MALATRADLQKKLMRLLGVRAEDGALVARGENKDEVLDDALQEGLWSTQRFLIDIGAGEDWLTNAALTFGAADATGQRTAAAPAGFLRFSGDDQFPALYDADSGRMWGQLLRDSSKRRFYTGDFYFWSNGVIGLTPLATPPDNVSVDYYERVTLPTGATVVDVEEDARTLITAEAAYHAMHEYWVPLHNQPGFTTRLARHRLEQRTEVAQRLRRDGGKQNVQTEPERTGTHYFLT